MSADFVTNLHNFDDEERELGQLDPTTALPESERRAENEAFRTASADGVKSFRGYEVF